MAERVYETGWQASSTVIPQHCTPNHIPLIQHLPSLSKSVGLTFLCGKASNYGYHSNGRIASARMYPPFVPSSIPNETLMKKIYITQKSQMFVVILSFLLLLISSTFCEAYLSRAVIPSHLQRHSSLQRQLSISSYSLDGSDPDRPSKVNQDSLFHQELENGSIAFGVMDGHGLQGHRLTRFLSLAFHPF